MTDKCIRFPLGFFDDARVKVIESMPHGNTIIYLWIRLIFLDARRIDATDGGEFVVRCGNDAAWTEEAISTATSTGITLVHSALAVLDTLGAFPSCEQAATEGRYTR